MKKFFNLSWAIYFFLGIATTSVVLCNSVRECEVSVPGKKTYKASFNCKLLREVSRVLSHDGYRLPLDNKKTVELVKKICADSEKGGFATKKEYTILKKADWSTKAAGNLIMKVQDSSFVFKIFSAGSECILGPVSKSIAEYSMWVVNRVNRFMLGFSRLSNRERLDTWLKKSKYAEKFRDKIIVPRKWLWVPEGVAKTSIAWKGKRGKKYALEVPNKYVIVCDACEKKRALNKDEMRLIYELVDAVPSNVTIDLNKSNFFVDTSGRIAFIDTENTDYIIDTHLNPVSSSDWFLQVFIAGLEACINTNLF
jgi:hypothetical protein